MAKIFLKNTEGEISGRMSIDRNPRGVEMVEKTSYTKTASGFRVSAKLGKETFGPYTPKEVIPEDVDVAGPSLL